MKKAELLICILIPYILSAAAQHTVKKMCKKGWQQKGVDIPNREIVESAYNFCRKYPNIKFHHIAAHTGLQDEHSIGNDHADRLANLAIGVESCPYSKPKGKLYLNIPYSEKDEAKKTWSEMGQ